MVVPPPGLGVLVVTGNGLQRACRRASPTAKSSTAAAGDRETSAWWTTKVPTGSVQVQA